MSVIKKIRVQSVKREGFTGYWCARRFIPSGEPLEMQVVDLGKNAAGAPIEPTVEVEVIDPTTQAKRKETRPDPVRVSPAGYDQLVEDPMVSVKEGDDLELSEAMARLTAVTVERDRLAADNAELARAKAAAEGKVVELQAALEAARAGQSGASASASQPSAPSSSDSAGSPSKGKGK